MELHQDTPYSNLDPNLICDAIESVGFSCSGSVFALNSYENRVYQIGLEDERYVIAKFYRPLRWSDEAILEEHTFALELVSAEIPVIAPIVSDSGQTLHAYQGYRFALFPRRGGRTLELDNDSHLQWMGRFIGRLHAVSALKSFNHRLQLDVNTYGYQCLDFLQSQQMLPIEIETQYLQKVRIILQKVEQCFALAGNMTSIRLHGDCHAGNVLWNDDGPHIVDLDDCLMGPAVQDLWMLLSGDEHQISVQIEHIVRGYREFYDFNGRELLLVEPLRTLRLLHYATWLAKRWKDPSFPLNFPWFNTLSYWQGHLQSLIGQEFLLDAIISNKNQGF